jgi:hypothetical protein
MVIAGVCADYDKLREIFVMVPFQGGPAGVRRVDFSLCSK